ncbi:MAG: hypothetical protein CMG04_00120 [Candidatus Marinimicrobia bacterium]|nr:hypothetical protein [Candidatus Neomarinimicrobiota bacterium]|tara:strand:+ start:269 stop:790 length:522 start_codon:yes stop_codon:yes gene_type:complete
MFERLKGVKKGTQVAEQISKGTMNLVNYLVNEGTELKTEDTLWICFNFYNYCVILTLEREKILSKVAYGGKVERKVYNFIEGLNYQTKILLKEWLQNSTGVYEVDPFFENLDQASIEYEIELRKKNSLGKHASIKSYYPDAVLELLCSHFENNSTQFKNAIGKQLESMRISLG